MIQKSSQPSPQASTKPESSTITDLEILSVIPASTKLLIPGDIQKFTIELNAPSQINKINFVLRRRQIQKEDDFQEIKIQTVNSSASEMMVTAIDPITSLSEYQLEVRSSADNSILGRFNYSSDVALEEKTTNNSLVLRQYLPYETQFYRLTYASERNVYIFSFKADPDAKESIESQYDKAKAEAIKFIQSKGIDINSVVVEWRYS